MKAGNRLFLNLPSGTAQARTVQAVNGNTVTVTTPYSETPEAECNWGVDSDDLFIALFRVTGTRDNNDGTFEVTGRLTTLISIPLLIPAQDWTSGQSVSFHRGFRLPRKYCRRQLLYG